jgi:glycosyltransferase involved in cell wall biosynthesis
MLANMSFQNPKVSVIIPNYNRALLIPATINSLLNQSYSNWEAIVVDDGSTDESAKVIEDFAAKDNRIKFFKRDREPKGAPTCRNIGFERSTGSFIIYLDSDDLLAPYCLSTRLSYFNDNPNCHFLIFPMLLFKENPGDSAILWNIDKQEDDIIRFFKSDPPWQTTSPIWKREAIIEIEGWDEEALAWQDWEFHIKSIVLGLYYKKIETIPDCFLRRD